MSAGVYLVPYPHTESDPAPLEKKTESLFSFRSIRVRLDEILPKRVEG